MTYWQFFRASMKESPLLWSCWRVVKIVVLLVAGYCFGMWLKGE